MMRLIEFTEENQPQWDADKEIRNAEKSGETTCTIEEIRKEEIPCVAQVNLMKEGAEKMKRKEQPQQTENITVLRDLRVEIEENIVNLNQWLSPRPRSAAKLIYKFERKLGAAVARMVRLGAIEEEEEQTPNQADKTELSLDNEEKIVAEKYVVGLSLAESVNSMTDELRLTQTMKSMTGDKLWKSNNEKLRDLTEKSETGLSLAEFEKEAEQEQIPSQTEMSLDNVEEKEENKLG